MYENIMINMKVVRAAKPSVRVQAYMLSMWLGGRTLQLVQRPWLHTRAARCVSATWSFVALTGSCTNPMHCTKSCMWQHTCTTALNRCNAMHVATYRLPTVTNMHTWLDAS